jgi:hypothetical protein
MKLKNRKPPQLIILELTLIIMTRYQRPQISQSGEFVNRGLLETKFDYLGSRCSNNYFTVVRIHYQSFYLGR